MFRVDHKAFVWLSGFSFLMVVEIGERLFFENRTAFWWFSVSNFAVGFIAMSASSVFLYFAEYGYKPGLKGLLVQRLVFSVLLAYIWLPVGLMGYADHLEAKRAKLTTCR